MHATWKQEMGHCEIFEGLYIFGLLVGYHLKKRSWHGAFLLRLCGLCIFCGRKVVLGVLNCALLYVFRAQHPLWTVVPARKSSCILISFSDFFILFGSTQNAIREAFPYVSHISIYNSISTFSILNNWSFSFSGNQINSSLAYNSRL